MHPETSETGSADSGASFSVFTVPSLHEVYPSEIANHPDRQKICLENPPAYARLDTMLDDMDIPSIDLLPAFRQAGQQQNINLVLAVTVTGTRLDIDSLPRRSISALDGIR